MASAGRSPYRRFDQPERLIGRDEDLVRVVEAERRQIDEQVMPVRQRQRDRGDVRRTPPAPPRPSRRACAAPSGCSCAAKVSTSARRTCAARGEVGRRRPVGPRRGHRRRHDAILGVGQRRVLDRAESRRTPSRSSSARPGSRGPTTTSAPPRVARDDRRPVLRAGLHERVRVRLSAATTAGPTAARRR